MKLEKMNQIFLDTAFVHAGGSDEELQVAQYFQKECAQLGLEASAANVKSIARRTFRSGKN